MKTRLFIKPYCLWSHRAMCRLEEHVIEYETLDVIVDASAFAEMRRLFGQELAPVVEANGRYWRISGRNNWPSFGKGWNGSDLSANYANLHDSISALF
jgi:glutaredoxin